MMATPRAQLQGHGVRSAPREHVVALDIGTHGSGCAYAPVKPGKRIAPRLHTDWPSQPVPYPKTRSAVLYKDRSAVAWGWEAYTKRLDVPADEQGSYHLVENFKLALHDDQRAAELKEATGVPMTQVMADFLKQFCLYVKKQLQAEHGLTTADLANVQWCITVPAMWSEKAKATMRKAAFLAGLIRSEDSDALAIILEPEAAALHALDTNLPPLTPGMTVCVLDVGGGTADVTVHAVEDRSGVSVLAEAVSAHGELCGSVYVDEAFRELYRDRVGGAAFDDWARQHPAEYTQLMNKWVNIKHSWRGRTDRRASPTPSPPPTPSTSNAAAAAAVRRAPNSSCTIGSPSPPAAHRGAPPTFPRQPAPARTTASPAPRAAGADVKMAKTDSDDDDDDDQFALDDFTVHRVPTPPHLHARLSEVRLAQLSEYQGGNHSDVLLTELDMFELFDPVVSQVVAAAQQQLRATKGKCDVVVLVGGFAASPYLQQRVKEGLQDKGLTGSVVVPPQPYAAVLQGAVLYGLNPSLIHARRSRMAYGVRSCTKYEEGAPGRFMHREKKIPYTDRKFVRFVAKRELVAADQVVQHKLYPLYSDQLKVGFDIYATDENSTKWIDDDNPNIRQLGRVTVDMLRPGAGRPCCVEFSFGATELKVAAWDVESGQKVRTSVTFAHT